MTGGRDREREERYRALFDMAYGPVSRYVRRRVDPSYADDAVADTMLVAWRRLDDIPVGAELPWCYGVARRVLANEVRAEARRLGLAARLQGEAVTGPAYDEGEGEGDHAELTSALPALAPDDRAVLALWAWEQLEPREIAVVLGISANAAAIRLHRAKKRLKGALEGGKDPHPSGHITGGHERTTR